MLLFPRERVPAKWALPWKPWLRANINNIMAAECVEESIDFLSQDHHGADLALSFVEGVDQSSNTMDNSTRDNEIVSIIMNS